jgi:DNA-binding NarL/FixJ family response regulator
MTGTCAFCGGTCFQAARVCRCCRPAQLAAQNRADRAELVDEVARLTRAGLTAQRIAWRLGLSRRTVERYLAEARTSA